MSTDDRQARALLAAACEPRIAPAAAEMIKAASLRHGGGFEVVFCCEYDDRTQQVTSAVPVFRGSRDRAIYVPHQFRYGQLMVHTHPTGRIEPSAADLDCAAVCAQAGVGFAICDPEGTSLYLITAPADVGLRTTKPTPAMHAWSQRIRQWSRTMFGRLTIAITLLPREAPPTT